MVGHVASVGEINKCIKDLSQNVKGRDNLKDLGGSGRIILKLVFRK
jgi:hypothetical protein